MPLHWTKILNSTLINNYFETIRVDRPKLSSAFNRMARIGRYFSIRRKKRSQSY